jgi:hypothetical protein
MRRSRGRLALPVSCDTLRNMPSEVPANAIEGVLSAVTACFDRASAEALLRLRAPASLQERIELLAGRNTEGLLTPEEREEYESLVRVGTFVAILQARARRQLAANQAA